MVGNIFLSVTTHPGSAATRAWGVSTAKRGTICRIVRAMGTLLPHAAPEPRPLGRFPVQTMGQLGANGQELHHPLAHVPITKVNRTIRMAVLVPREEPLVALVGMVGWEAHQMKDSPA